MCMFVYVHVTENYGDLVDGYSKYMAANHMVVQPEFNWLHMVQGL